MSRVNTFLQRCEDMGLVRRGDPLDGVFTPELLERYRRTRDAMGIGECCLCHDEYPKSQLAVAYPTVTPEPICEDCGRNLDALMAGDAGTGEVPTYIREVWLKREVA